MSKLFILGSGFSRATSQEMPTIRGLGKFVQANLLGKLETDVKISESLLMRDGQPVGVEELLTYLFQELPWKSPREALNDKAAYLLLAGGIAEEIRCCEERAFSHPIPSWAYDFARYLHRTGSKREGECTVVSFNYDTILERLSRLLREPDEHEPPRFECDSWLLDTREVIWPEFLKKLKTDDPVSTYLRSRLKEETRNALSEWSEEDVPELLQKAVLSDLNELISSESIWDAERFSRYGLDSEVVRLVGTDATEDDLKYTNRRLIRHAFHNIVVPDATHISTDDLYGMPLDNLVHRTTGTWGSTILTTFRLLKLHGSTNWYFSGSSDFPGEQVYYTPVDSPLPSKDYENMRDYVERNRIGLTPMIIPPVSEKGTFYKNRLVNSMWGAFREAIEEAQEIFIVGYSLPITDLSMSLFLTTNCMDFQGIVHLVDTATGDDKVALLDRYALAFPQARINDSFCGHIDAVQQMVGSFLE